MNENGKLTPRQEKTICALLEHPTIEKAAEAAGVNSRTIRKWMKDPSFKTAFREAGRKVVEQAHALLRQASCEAVEALRRNLKCETPGVEVRAALGILDQCTRFLELEDQAERLTAMEEALKEWAGGDQ